MILQAKKSLIINIRNIAHKYKGIDAMTFAEKQAMIGKPATAETIKPSDKR
jgi:hypothetical protein